MPIFALLVAAYIAAALAAFGGYSMAAAVGAALVVLAARTPRAASIAAFAAGGILAATATQTASARCVSDARVPIVAALVVDASPGSLTNGVSSCGARVEAFVLSGSASIGSTVRIDGDLRRAVDRVMIERATITVLHGPGLLARWRVAMGRRIDSLFGGDAPMVRALILADKHGLSPEVRDRFAQAGLAHVLAIAGFHVGVLAALIELLAGAMGVHVTRRPAVAFGVVIVYVAAIGAPAAAMRAALMLGARAAARAFQRPTSPWSLLAIGASACFVDVGVVADSGFQLSIAGVAGMIAASRVVARLRFPRRAAFKRRVATALMSAAIISVVTAPLAVWWFGRVSIVGPIATIVVAPVLALTQPVLIAALAMGGLPVARFAASAAHPLLAALNAIAAFAAGLPGASLETSFTPLAMTAACALSVAVVAACLGKRIMLPVAVAVACAGALIVPHRAPDSGLTELHMINVGQGDAIALRTPHGHWVLFDAGPSAPGMDAGRSIVLPYIARRGGVLDAFVLSHPHTDHVGGAAAVIRALAPHDYYDPGYAASTESYRHSIQAAAEEHTVWHRVHPDDSISDDGVVIKFLAPDSAWASSLADPNNASTIALVRIGTVRFLLVGDAEKAEEHWLLDHDSSDVHADVLKVGHHGSSTSSTEPFLNAVHPRIALVSVGVANKYGHPSAPIMAALAKHGAQVLRTDQLGSIVVETDGKAIWVNAAGERWSVPRDTLH